MRWMMILGGAVVVAISIALAMALDSQVDALKLIIEANSRLNASEKMMLNDWFRMTPTCMVGIIVAGLLAALPYFALAQLLKPAPPRH